VREVFEETGFNCGHLIEEANFLEMTIRGQRIRLYVVPNVDENTPFAPRTRKEISAIAWHLLGNLPSSAQHRQELSKTNKENFYMVAPFLNKVRGWMKRNRKRYQRKWRSKQRLAAVAQLEASAADDPFPSDEEDEEEEVGEYSSGGRSSDEEESSAEQIDGQVRTDLAPFLRQRSYNPALQATVTAVSAAATESSRRRRQAALAHTGSASASPAAATAAPTHQAGLARLPKLPSEPERFFNFQFEFDRDAVLTALDDVLFRAG
jgi:hypothetical protein